MLFGAFTVGYRSRRILVDEAGGDPFSLIGPTAERANDYASPNRSGRRTGASLSRLAYFQANDDLPDRTRESSGLTDSTSTSSSITNY